MINQIALTSMIQWSFFTYFISNKLKITGFVSLTQTDITKIVVCRLHKRTQEQEAVTNVFKLKSSNTNI